MDQSQDLTGAEERRLLEAYPAPDFVKRASHARRYGEPDMAAHLYADPHRRQYPINAAAATWLSTLFFMDKRAAMPPAVAAAIDRRLTAQAEYFGIGAHVAQLKQAMAAAAAATETAEPDENFAMVWVDDTGAKTRQYPLRNAAETKTAADWFERYRDEFVFADRHQIAQRIFRKAAQLAVPLDNAEVIEKTAGFGSSATADVADAMEARAALTARSHRRESQEMTKLAAIVRQTASLQDRDLRLKLAASIDQFDRATQLTAMYANGSLARPEELLFCITQKIAADAAGQHVMLTSGTVYEKSALAALALPHICSWMGGDFGDEVAAGGLLPDVDKLAAVAASLPRDDAEAFDRMAAAAGVRPYAISKAAGHIGLTPEDIRHFAASHASAAG